MHSSPNLAKKSVNQDISDGLGPENTEMLPMNTTLKYDIDENIAAFDDA